MAVSEPWKPGAPPGPRRSSSRRSSLASVSRPESPCMTPGLSVWHWWWRSLGEVGSMKKPGSDSHGFFVGEEIYRLFFLLVKNHKIGKTSVGKYTIYTMDPMEFLWIMIGILWKTHRPVPSRQMQAKEQKHMKLNIAAERVGGEVEVRSEYLYWPYFWYRGSQHVEVADKRNLETNPIRHVFVSVFY